MHLRHVSRQCLKIPYHFGNVVLKSCERFPCVIFLIIPTFALNRDLIFPIPHAYVMERVDQLQSIIQVFHVFHQLPGDRIVRTHREVRKDTVGMTVS